MFDQQTLVKIYDEYHTPIYRYVYRQAGDVETARDLTADVFQKLVRVAERRTPIEQVSARLYRTAIADANYTADARHGKITFKQQKRSPALATFF